MAQNFPNPAVASLPQRGPAMNGQTVLKAIVELQKLDSCSVNSVKKYLASQYGIDCQTLDATIKPIMKMAMDRNILKNLGDTGKVSECKRRRKASAKKGKKSKSRRRKKSSKGKKSGGKRRRKSKKAAAPEV